MVIIFHILVVAKYALGIVLYFLCNRVKGSVIFDQTTATCSAHFSACVLVELNSN